MRRARESLVRHQEHPEVLHCSSSRLTPEGSDQRHNDKYRTGQAEQKRGRLGPLRTAARGSIRRILARTRPEPENK